VTPKKAMFFLLSVFVWWGLTFTYHERGHWLHHCAALAGKVPFDPGDPWHPWWNLAWLCHFGKYMVWVSASVTALAFLILALAVPETPLVWTALFFIPWLPELFYPMRWMRPEAYTFFAVVLASAFIHLMDIPAIAILVGAVCIGAFDIHPQGAFVFPAVLVAVKGAKARLWWIAVCLGAFIFIERNVPWQEMYVWLKVNHYLHADTFFSLPYPDNFKWLGPALFGAGGHHMFLIHIAIKIFLFGAMGYALTQKKSLPYATYRFILFSFAYCLSVGLFSGQQYPALTEPFIFLGGLASCDALLA